jgi:hypothetical protein
VTICCGDEELVHLETTVPPSLTSEEPDCSDPAYRASVQLLQVQAQICRGGRLNLCPKAGELTLPCDGDGAATVTATSRVALARPNLPANRRPTIGAVDWRTPLDGPAPVEVKGCLEPSCDDRQCGDEDDCDAGQVCHENRCREEFALTLEEGDIEDFLLDCEESRPCADRSDCPDRWDCRDGQCRRRENPVTSFFTTAGSFSRSRVVLDSDADGLPDQSTFTTRWLPPVLEGCRAEDAPCAFGSCDLDVGYCVGEVSFWSVVRDERGGQDWAQWTMRVVP